MWLLRCFNDQVTQKDNLQKCIKVPYKFMANALYLPFSQDEGCSYIRVTEVARVCGSLIVQGNFEDERCTTIMLSIYERSKDGAPCKATFIVLHRTHVFIHHRIELAFFLTIPVKAVDVLAPYRCKPQDLNSNLNPNDIHTFYYLR